MRAACDHATVFANIGLRSARLSTLDITPGQRSPSPQAPKKSDLGGLYHGFQFAVTTMAGMAAGYWLDRHYLPMPLGILGGLLVGSVVGMYVLAKALKKK